jgi:hypothetical protein
VKGFPVFHEVIGGHDQQEGIPAVFRRGKSGDGQGRSGVAA